MLQNIKITCSAKTLTGQIIAIQQSLISQNPETWGNGVQVKRK